MDVANLRKLERYHLLKLYEYRSELRKLTGDANGLTPDDVCDISGCPIEDFYRKRTNKASITRKVFALIFMHIYGYKELSIQFGKVKGFSRSTISILLNDMPWEYDFLTKNLLKKVMIGLRLKKLTIHFSREVDNLQINVNDL